MREPKPISVVTSSRICASTLLVAMFATAAHAEPPAAPAKAKAAASPAAPATSAAPAATSAAPATPAAITPPATARQVLRLHAEGFQVYKCGPLPTDAAKIGWSLKQPDAALADAAGKPAGTHGAGPSWTAKDGSSVTGKKAAESPSPKADAVPWLLLGAVSHAGQGVLAKVSFIQRVNTAGGKAPATGCDAATGHETRVPYSADYVFFE